jgi:Arc/MetJ-type ribon-helix-helix transcriptional regulator
MSRMVVFTVHLPPEYVEALQQLVDAHLYHSLAEAVRMAVRDLITKESRLLWSRNPPSVAGATDGTRPNGRLVMLSFRMPRVDYTVLRGGVGEGYYASVSEAVRDAVHNLVTIGKELLKMGPQSPRYVDYVARLSKQDYAALDELVSAGVHINASDVLRTAVKLHIFRERGLL